MKKTLILALAAFTVLISGCDFVRTLAGRPTAAQVEQIRLERMAREEALHQARLDSMRKAEQHLADSIAALEAFLRDSLVQAQGTRLNPAKMGSLFTTKLDAHYCIIVGAYRTRSYAERKLKLCNDAGYTGTILSFRNGLLAVAICPSDDLRKTVNTLNKLRGTGVCPRDSWLLINE